VLVEQARIAIPRGAVPGFDHADLDAASQRLHVADTGADRVEVIDCTGATTR